MCHKIINLVPLLDVTTLLDLYLILIVSAHRMDANPHRLSYAGTAQWGPRTHHAGNGLHGLHPCSLTWAHGNRNPYLCDLLGTVSFLRTTHSSRSFAGGPLVPMDENMLLVRKNAQLASSYYIIFLFSLDGHHNKEAS